MVWHTKDTVFPFIQHLVLDNNDCCISRNVGRTKINLVTSNNLYFSKPTMYCKRYSVALYFVYLKRMLRQEVQLMQKKCIESQI